MLAEGAMAKRYVVDIFIYKKDDGMNSVVPAPVNMLKSNS
jgi:hypothetical protein